MQVRSPRRILFILLDIALVLLIALVLRLAAAAADPPDLTFTKRIVVQTPNGPVDVTEADALEGDQVRIRLAVTNNSAERVNLLVADVLAPPVDAQTAACSPELASMRTQFSGAPTLALDPALLGLDPAAYFAAMVLELDPGATWEAQIAVPVRTDTINCLLHGYGTVWGATAVPIEGSCNDGASPECRYAGWTPREADVVQLQEALMPLPSNDVEIAIVSPDLGDAPDSTNHFGVPMRAYPLVQAEFPTVFDPATGLPEGPKHRHARPLRLGQMASREPDADLNPNRNLNPPTNQPNLDTFDDGLNPALVNPIDCQVTTFPLRVTIQQPSIDYLVEKQSTAYLNIWLDVNRDGDWADNFDCGNDPATEHILINAPVDVAALGVGIHTLTVATELIRWPTDLAEDPAWLRVSLSDSPAPTPLTAGLINYGDGRGPNPPYVLGETEDYLWTPGGGGGQGPDVAVQLNGRVQIEDVPMATPPSMAQIAATRMLTHPYTLMQLKVNFGNLGDQTATGTRLVVMPDPALRDRELVLDVTGDPPLPADRIEQRCDSSTPDCRVIVDLGDLPPQRFGTLLVSARARCQQFSDELCGATVLAARAFVETENDANATNDEATKTWEFKQTVGKTVPPAIIGAQMLIPMPEMSQQSNYPQIVAGGCLTCIDVVGVAVPFETVNVLFDGLIVDAPQAGGSGQFMSWADGFAPGLHKISASYLAGHEDEIDVYNYFHAPELPWDPASWTLTVSQFGVQGGAITFPPLTADGIANAERWQIPIWPGAEVEMELRSRCDGPAQFGFLIGGVPVAQLTDPDQDGVYTGRFTAEDQMANRPAGLRVRCEDADQTFRGRTVATPPLPKIVDAQTGAPIAGAKVTLWQNYTATDDLWTWRMWPGSYSGHPNPQMTDADGEFLFVVPEGVYRLDVMAPGYQPFSSGRFRLDGIFPGFIFRPSPAGDGTTEHFIIMTSEGFNPPAVEMRAGEQVAWSNADIDGHSVVSGSDGNTQLAAAVTAGWDSGIINPGGRFVLRLDQPGTYTVVDGANPLNQATLIVTSEAEGNTLYLPNIMR